MQHLLQFRNNSKFTRPVTSNDLWMMSLLYIYWESWRILDFGQVKNFQIFCIIVFVEDGTLELDVAHMEDSQSDKVKDFGLL